MTFGQNLQAEAMIMAPNKDAEIFMCLNKYVDDIWLKLANKGKK